ncbi:MAG: Na(+)/H(+) antiporter subunit B [Thermodesulfovibrio sp.]
MIRLYDDLIIQTVCRIMIPLIQLFAFYVIAHGHYSPGGGFQGGCILGASFILMVIAYDINWMKRRFSEKKNTLLMAFGVLIYALVGVLCILLGAEYLNYGILNKIIPTDSVKVRALGTLIIEIGVGITVMAVMVSIFLNLTTFGKHEKGEV